MVIIWTVLTVGLRITHYVFLMIINESNEWKRTLSMVMTTFVNVMTATYVNVMTATYVVNVMTDTQSVEYLQYKIQNYSKTK